MYEVTSEKLNCPDGMPVLVARPRQPGSYPIVVLMHERYGLVRNTEELDRRCAADGYVACAPNFFCLHTDQAAITAGNSRYDMTDPESVTSLESVLALLETNRLGDLRKIAVAGFCRTGRHPLVFAARR